MPNRFPFNTPEHPEDNRSINKAFDRNYGNRLKSGDTTPLKYTIKDGDGEPLDKERLPNMQTSLILKYEGVTAYKTEFEATLEEVTENYVGDLVARFRIDEVLPPSDTPYVVEFHFEDDEDLFIFPSANTLELYITPSALNSDEEAIKSISDQRLNEIIERKLEENPVLSEAEANELARQENYQELLDTGVMQENINQKLAESEAEYAPRLTSLEQNDADIGADIKVIKQGRGKTKIPLVTFTSDDGAIEDYTKLKPIFETKGVPCTLGIVSDWVGQTGRMDIVQIKELESLGWEIASHTKTHPFLATLTKEQIEVEAKQSKEELESMGFKIDNFIYPYGSQNLQVREVANEHYNCSVQAGYPSEPAISGQINSGVLKTHELTRIPLGSFMYSGGNTLDYYKSKVDLAVENNAWLIFMMHPWHEDHDETQQSILSSLIDYIKSLSVPIVNMRDGHDLVGNILDIGDVEKEHRVAISSVGEVEKNKGEEGQLYVEIPYQGITPETLPESFPPGKISIAQFPWGNDSGFPGEGSAGQLETYRFRDDMVHQEFTTWVGGYKLQRVYDIKDGVYQWSEFADFRSSFDREDITPELLNGWVGMPYWGGLTYTKTADGLVIVNGGVGGGTGEVLFYLPVGYRPDSNMFFFIGTAEGPRDGQVRSDGAVLIPSFAIGGEFKISFQFPAS